MANLTAEALRPRERQSQKAKRPPIRMAGKDQIKRVLHLAFELQFCLLRFAF
jgi:hypothetical protein